MRIAIVNDMAMAVETMRRLLTATPGWTVAWIARDGVEAVEKCAADVPDLILMDLIMPNLDGVEATRQIMAKSPCAILVVTATVDGNLGKVFEAMGVGALDVVQTPALGSAQGVAMFRAKIEMLGKLVGNNTPKHLDPGSSTSFLTKPSEKLVAIGASAGGPAAVAEVLRGLPKDFPAAIVVVQHVDAQFAAGLAEWLNQQSPLPVRLAKNGDRLQNGVVLMAGGDDHLIFKAKGSHELTHTPDPKDYSYRPSVDVFFESAARNWPGKLVGVLLTGMGRDGAMGLKKLRDAGVLTIAQDKASCAVYGMPKAAADLKAAVEILPLSQIGSRLVNHYFPGHCP